MRIMNQPSVGAGAAIAALEVRVVSQAIHGIQFGVISNRTHDQILTEPGPMPVREDTLPWSEEAMAYEMEAFLG